MDLFIRIGPLIWLTVVLRVAVVLLHIHALAVCSSILWIPVTIYGISCYVRRLHDLNLSGLFIVIWTVPISVGMLFRFYPISSESDGGTAPLLAFAAVLLVFFAWPGTKGPNRFGPPT